MPIPRHRQFAGLYLLVLINWGGHMESDRPVSLSQQFGQSPSPALQQHRPNVRLFDTLSPVAVQRLRTGGLRLCLVPAHSLSGYRSWRSVGRVYHLNMPGVISAPSMGAATLDVTL